MSPQHHAPVVTGLPSSATPGAAPAESTPTGASDRSGVDVADDADGA